jgi:CheY-like chemotaxis protein
VVTEQSGVLPWETSPQPMIPLLQPSLWSKMTPTSAFCSCDSSKRRFLAAWSSQPTALKLMRSITPHRFLLDYHLPSMTGFELVDHLRTIPTLEQTPIFLMSARMPRDGVKQRQLQAIRKPFDLNELLQLVREQLPASD